MNALEFQWKIAADGETDNTAVMQRMCDTGAPLIFFPEGKYKFERLDVRSNQRIVGENVSREDGSRGTLFLPQCTEGAALQFGTSTGAVKFSGLETLRIKRSDPTQPTVGVQLSNSTGYHCNTFRWLDVFVEGFGVGFESHGADNSRLVGGGLHNNGINGRSSQNDSLLVQKVYNGGALTYGWHQLGSRSVFEDVLFADNPCHLKLNTGSDVVLKRPWFEITTGEVAAIDMEHNTSLLVEAATRMKGSGETIPFVNMIGGFLQFVHCRGMSEAFVAPYYAKIYGQGETGLKDGLPYTAGGYPVTP